MLLENAFQTDKIIKMAERLLPSEFTTSKEVARTLLDAQVFSLDTQKGFRLSSGILSPVYADLRILGSNVDARTKIVDHFVSKIQDQDAPDAIAGVATAGISWGTLVADRMRLPFVFVRPTPKDHGTGKQIEGVVFPRQNIPIFEDVISTGKSSLSSIDALRTENANANKIFAIMDYQLFDSEKNVQEQGVEIESLTTFPEIIDIAQREAYWDRETLLTIKQWYENPYAWDTNKS